MPLLNKNKPKNNTKSKVKSKQNRKTFITKKKAILGITIIALAAFGAWRVFFSEAASNNCNNVDGGRICDVNQASNGTDSVWSINEEAEALGNAGWIYYGAAFRAPTFPQNGAEAVYRTTFAPWTMHSLEFWEGMDRTRRNGGAQEGIIFYAWRDGRQPGTVPVYHLTRGGWYLVKLYTTDKAWYDRMVAQGDYWVGEGVAFWAYPPNYAPPNQANAFDCSRQENFLSDRCAGARQQLQTNIEAPAGSAPKPTGSAPAPTAPASPRPQSPQPAKGGEPDCSAPNPTQATKEFCTNKFLNALATQGGAAAPPAQQVQDCSAPNPSAETKERCTKIFLETLAKTQNNASVATAVPLAAVPQPAQPQNCSAPNPSDWTKEYCRGVFWGAQSQRGVAVPGDLPNCSAPNPSELIKAFCQGQLIGAVTQARFQQQQQQNEQRNQQKAERNQQATTSIIQGTARTLPTGPSKEEQELARYFVNLSIAQQICKQQGGFADAKTFQCSTPRQLPIRYVYRCNPNFGYRKKDWITASNLDEAKKKCGRGYKPEYVYNEKKI